MKILLKNSIIFLFFCFFLSGNAQQHAIKKSTQQKDSIVIAKKKANNYYKRLREYHRKRDNETAKQYSDSLLIISRQYKFRNMELLALMNYGVYYNEINKFEKALDFYLEVIEKCETIPEYEKTKIMAMINTGNIYNHIQSYKKAISIFDEALPLINKHQNNTYPKSALYTGLAVSYTDLGDINTALEYNYKVVALAESSKKEYMKVLALSNISDLYYRIADYKTALKFGTESLMLNKIISDSISRKDLILLRVGLAHKGLKNMNKAIAYLEESKKIAHDKKNTSIEIECYENLAEIYESLGDYKKSHQQQKRYTQLNESFLKEKKNTAVLDVERNVEKKEDIINQQIKNIRKKKRLLLYGGILLTLVSGLLYFFIRRKNTITIEREQIKKSYLLLKGEYATLKESLQSVGKINQGKSDKYKSSSLTKEDRDLYMKQILDYMEQESPYLEDNITQVGLAKKLGMTSHHLSEVLNFCFEQNFYNFINIYRVNKAKEILKNNTLENHKIEIIGYDAGFSNKSSFNRVFKNLTGVTPSQYQKKLA